MAGGTSIWATSDAKTDPKAIFNGRLLYLLITLAWAGCFYGYDTDGEKGHLRQAAAPKILDLFLPLLPYDYG